jgi:hypothetical protein
MTNQAKLLKLIIITFQLAFLICYFLIKAFLFKALLGPTICMGVIYIDYIFIHTYVSKNKLINKFNKNFKKFNNNISFDKL